MIKANIAYDLTQPLPNESGYWNPDELKFTLTSPSYPLLRYFDECCGWRETKQYDDHSITITCQYNSQIYKLKELALRLCEYDEDQLRGGIYGEHVKYDSHFSEQCKEEN